MSQEPYVPIESVAKHFSVSISTIRAWVRQSHRHALTRRAYGLNK
jgi:transposase